MIITIEMSYLADDCFLLFELCDSLGRARGIKSLGASGGLIIDESGARVGRDGAISVEAKDTQVVQRAVDRLLPAISKRAKVTRMQMVISEETNPSLSQAYLPPQFREPA